MWQITNLYSNRVLFGNRVIYRDVEPGLSEFAVEAWERQTLKADPSFMLVKGKWDEPFVVWITRELWYKWYYEWYPKP